VILSISKILPKSKANGPGTRFTIWVQGCSLGCLGCWNPKTHSFSGGEAVEVDDLLAQIKVLATTGEIEGITFTGGEPLQQKGRVTELMRRVKAETDLSIVLFTGFSLEEISTWRDQRFMDYVDVIQAGRYDEKRPIKKALLSSENQEIRFLTDRYGPADLKRVPDCEIVIRGGKIHVTGVNPLRSK